MIKPTPIYVEGLPTGKELLMIGPATDHELLRVLDEVMAVDGEWDQPLLNFAVYQHGKGFGLCAVEVPEPYASAPPWVGLPAWAEHAWKDPMVRADLAPLFTGKFFGWLMVLESWGVTIDPDAEPEDRARLEKARRNRTFHAQPDRHEARMYFLAGPDGLLTNLRRVRGQNGEEDHVEEMVDVGGRFPNLVRRFADLGARIQYLRQKKADTSA